MWMIARRTFTEEWFRLLATMFAAIVSVGLIAGVLQFAMRAQAAAGSSHASEYAAADLIVQPAGAPSLANSDSQPPSGFIPAATLARIAAYPGVQAAAGDAIVPITAVGTGDRVIPAPAGSATMLRPWLPDSRLSAYHLVAGHAPQGPGEVVVDQHVATSGGLRDGGSVTLLLPRTTWRARIVGIATIDGSSSAATGDIVLASPATVQQAAALPGGAWQDVLVKAAPGISAPRLRAELSARLGAAAQVSLAAQVASAQIGGIASLGAQVGAVMGILAVLGVFVGLFVVANTFGTLIGQRTRQLAMLRTIGATPRQVKRLVRLEALCFGVLASVAGLAAGAVIDSVLATVFAGDGFDITQTGFQFNAVYVIVPLTLGVAATQLAARRAARQAAGVSPMAALRDTATEGRTWSLRRLIAILVLIGVTVAFVAIAASSKHKDPTTSGTIGAGVLVMIGGMFAIGAVSLIAPYVVRPVGGLVGSLGAAVRGEVGWLARASITRRPRRVASAVSALMMGVALATAGAIVVTSVEANMRSYGDKTLTAAAGVTTAGRSLGGVISLPADVTARVAAVPGVALAVPLSETSAVVLRPQKPLQAPVSAGDVPPPTINLTGADPSSLRQVIHLSRPLPRLGTGQIALAANFAEAYRLRPGDKVTLQSANGDVTLTYVGAYWDPSHLFLQDGLVTPRSMALLTGDAGTAQVLVRAAPHASVTTLTARLTRAVADVPVARVFARTALVSYSAGAYVREFNLLYVFLAMAVFVALFGLGTTISLNVAERRREFGLLGAVAATRAQLRSIVRWEAATVVLIGSVLGIVTAVVIAWLVRAAAGTGLVSPVPQLSVLGLIVAGAAVVTLLSSVLPARRAASVPVLEAAAEL